MNRGKTDFKYEKPTVGFLDKIPDPVGFLGTCPGTYPVQPWLIDPKFNTHIIYVIKIHQTKKPEKIIIRIWTFDKSNF